MSEFNELNQNFKNITYSKIIEEILKVNDDSNYRVFTSAHHEKNRYHVRNLTKLSMKVAENMKDLSIANVLNTTFDDVDIYHILSTLSFQDSSSENAKFKELEEHLRYIVDELNIAPAHKDLYSGGAFRKSNIGTKSKFEETNSLLGSICYDASSELATVTRQDIAEVYQDTTNIESDIEQSLIKLYKKRFKDLDEDEIDEIVEYLKNRDVLTDKIRDYILLYRDGYLKRVVGGPLYLNFINDFVQSKKSSLSSTHSSAIELLETYAKRANELEVFVQDSLINDADNTYQIEYLNTTLDFIHYIRTNFVYEWLPFVGKMTSPLGDTRDDSRNKGHETYGISLKRNGKVSKYGFDSSFEYHLNDMNLAGNASDSQSYELNRFGLEFVKAILFKYMLVGLDNPNYDAVAVLKSDLLKYKELGMNTTAKATCAVKELLHDVNVSKSPIMAQLKGIKLLLNDCLDKDSSVFSKRYTRNFSLLSSILPKSEELDDGIFLDHIKDNKKYNKLNKYTILLDGDIPEDSYAYSYKYEITFSSHSLSRGDSDENIKIEYNRDYFEPFSIIYYPSLGNFRENDAVNSSIYNTKECSAKLSEFIDTELMPKSMNVEIKKGQYEKVPTNFEKDGFPAVFFDYYNHPILNETERFVYESTYTIVSSILSSMLCKKLSLKTSRYLNLLKRNIPEEELKQKKPFIDKSLYILNTQITFNPEKGRYNKNGDVPFNDSQGFIRSLRKCISSSLSSKYTSTSQGFNLQGNVHKAKNSLNSQYGKIPRIVQLNRQINSFDKLAVIINTSRKHNQTIISGNDNESCGEKYESTIFGEVLTIANLGNGKFKVSSYREYADFVGENEIHKNPQILSDVVSELSSIGYKDFVYLAHSPFSATMIEKREGTEMYFMNEDVMKSIIEYNSDVRVYPIYTNNCNIHHNEDDKCNGFDNAVYTSIAKGMNSIGADDCEGIVPLFQMFSGNAVNDSSDSFYRQMIVYSTIKGIYSNEIKKNVSTEAMLENDGDNDLVKDFMAIFTSIHILRNNKDLKTDEKYKPIKNNPYDNIFGDNNLGNISKASYSIKRSGGNNKCFSINRLSLVSYISKTNN